MTCCLFHHEIWRGMCLTRCLTSDRLDDVHSPCTGHSTLSCELISIVDALETLRGEFKEETHSSALSVNL